MSGDGAVDPLAACPRCLQPRELTGVGDTLAWICACGRTLVGDD